MFVEKVKDVFIQIVYAEARATCTVQMYMYVPTPSYFKIKDYAE
jgi:hypothetical protein